MDHRHRFDRLDALLEEHAWLWRPQPYKEPRPRWTERLPELRERLLALSEADLTHFSRNDAALYDLLSDHRPALSELHILTALPRLPQVGLVELGPHFPTDIPGRKWAQINAFAAAIRPSDAPVLDWCGGKGHLGRFVSAQWQRPVLTLEQQPKLCDEGERLARRAGVAQRFRLGDALSSTVKPLLSQRHSVSLHACGGLHRRLIEGGIESRVPALDIAPCCYHLYGGGHYQPFTPGSGLRPAHEDLRLAVTETVTARRREMRQRDREMAWKLGFQQLRKMLTGSAEYVPTRPIDKRWLGLTFASFCHRLAERQALELPRETEWERIELSGWQRHHEVMRLSLARHAFRRPLELWLVLDLVNRLATNGYEVRLGTFCDVELTPRNVLISARRQ